MYQLPKYPYSLTLTLTVGVCVFADLLSNKRQCVLENVSIIVIVIPVFMTTI